MVMAGHQLAHPHRHGRRETGHQEDGPVTAKQQAKGTTGEPHHGDHQPGVIVEGDDGFEALAHFTGTDQLFFRHDADPLDLAHHLHIDAMFAHPPGSGNTAPLIEAGEHDGTGRDGHLDTLQPQRHPQPHRGLLDDPALRPELGQHLTHLDDNAGDLCLLLPRQHPSWCDTSHNPFES